MLLAIASLPPTTAADILVAASHADFVPVDTARLANVAAPPYS